MSELYSLCCYVINKKSLNINIDQLRKTSKHHLLNQFIHGDIRQDQLASFNQVDSNILNTMNRIVVCSFSNSNDSFNLEEKALSLLETAHYCVPCEVWSPKANQVLLLFNDATRDLRLSYDIARLTLFKLSSLNHSLTGIGIGDAVETLDVTLF